jgi:hypothetical protein
MNAKFLIPLLYHLFCLLRGPVNVFHRSVEAMLYSESLPCSSSFPVRSRNNVPRVRFTLLQRDDYISCYLDCFNTYSAYKEGESGLYSLDIIDMNSIYCFVVHAQGVPGYIYSGDLRKNCTGARLSPLRPSNRWPTAFVASWSGIKISSTAYFTHSLVLAISTTS